MEIAPQEVGRSSDIRIKQRLMYHYGLKGKKRESYRIDALLKYQIDNYARAHKLDRQEVIARAVSFAHPTLSVSNGKYAEYAHLRRRKEEVVETTVITPKLTEETLNQIEDIKRVKGKSAGKVLSLALNVFFTNKEKQAVGALDHGALSTFCAPNFYLAGERFKAPWIERAPQVPYIEYDRNLLPERLAGRTVYVGADFFLTMMTALELKNGPRSRDTAGSRDVLGLTAKGKMNLVTSAAEFHRFAGLGGALVEARDETHFWKLVHSFKSGGVFAHSGSQAITARMRCVQKMGIRIVSTGLEEYISACEFMRTSYGSSFNTLLGLATLAHVAPGEVVMLRFLSGSDHPAMLVWQEFSEDGELMRMTSRDIKQGSADRSGEGQALSNQEVALQSHI
jgi:hypothetical protein